MKRMFFLLSVLCVSFVSVAGAQQAANKPPFGRHVPHRMVNQTSNTSGVALNQNLNTQANLNHKEKIWELGTYLGGTWVTTWHINDLDVIAGLGDVDGSGYTHTLAVPLFGPTAGEWTDLGTLAGEQSIGCEEPIDGISDTGLVVSGSVTSDGHMHAVAWTKQTGMVDLGTLADTGDPRYANHNSSYAISTNKLGTLIVGGSGVDQDTNSGFDSPVVWTPSKEWKNGKFVTKWNIHALDTASYSNFWWVPFGVNDFGQIVAAAGDNNNPQTTAIGALWNPRPDGRGWKVMAVPPSSAYPFTDLFGINENGEIAGMVTSTDLSVWLPALWKPVDRTRTTYSPVIMLPLPQGVFTNAEAVGINDLGDIVGDTWNDDVSIDLAVRWTTKDLTFSELLNFPADWSFSWGVNNNRIASVTYTGGEKCSAGVPWVYTCGGAIQLH
jgi:probable HAF family extracellular repeat protein